METLFNDFSLEMTGKDAGKLEDARDTIPPGTRINVTFLENEDGRQRLDAVRAVKRFGYVPVPHISARRLRSHDLLEEYLSALAAEDASDNVLVIAGDPTQPLGPFDDSLAVIKSGMLQQYGVRHVGVGGYPEGHPAISESALWSALEGKAATLGQLGLPGVVITQFGFDVDPVLKWLEAVRERGIDLPVRIGVPGPAGVRRLVTMAWPSGRRHQYGDREEIRVLDYQPDGHRRAGQVHSRAGRRPRPRAARRGEAALLHVRRPQGHVGMDRRVPPGRLALRQVRRDLPDVPGRVGEAGGPDAPRPVNGPVDQGHPALGELIAHRVHVVRPDRELHARPGLRAADRRRRRSAPARSRPAAG